MQETRINPIQMNDTGAAMLQKLGTDVAQIQLQKEKAEADKARYKQDLMLKQLQAESEFQKSVMPQVDGAKLADEILEQGLTQIKTIASQEKDVFSKQKELTQALIKLKENSEAFKAPFAMLDEYYKGLPEDQKKGFDLAGAQNYVREQLQLNDGNVTRYKTAEEIGDPSKIVGGIMGGSGAYKFWTPAAGREAVDKDIKEMQPSTISVEKRDQKGLVRTGEKVEVQFKPLIQEFDEKAGKVKLKTDALGYINDEAFDKYVADPKINSWLTREAIRIADQHNNPDIKASRAALEGAGVKNLDKDGGWPQMILPDTPEFNYIKKALLTRYLGNYTNEVQKEIDSKTIVNTTNMYGGGANQLPVRDYFGQLEQLVDSRQKGMSAAVNDLPSNLVNLVVDAANAGGGGIKKRGKVVPYTYADIVLKRSPEGFITIYRAKDGKQISSLDGERFNAEANSYLTNKAARAGQNAGTPR